MDMKNICIETLNCEEYDGISNCDNKCVKLRKNFPELQKITFFYGQQQEM